MCEEVCRMKVKYLNREMLLFDMVKKYGKPFLINEVCVAIAKIDNEEFEVKFTKKGIINLVKNFSITWGTAFKNHFNKLLTNKNEPRKLIEYKKENDNNNVNITRKFLNDYINSTFKKPDKIWNIIKTTFNIPYFKNGNEYLDKNELLEKAYNYVRSNENLYKELYN